MTDPQPLEQITIANEQSLNTLARAIAYSQGEFSLILARCNYAALRERMMQALRSQCPVEIRELNLPASSKTLYTAIQSELGVEQPSALMVFGLEDVSELDTVLSSTNQVREEFRKEFPFPLVLWINDTILQKLIKLVPDLESWSTAIEFENTSQALLEFLKITIDRVFTTILDFGSGPFQGKNPLKLGRSDSRWQELELVQKDLQNQGVTLTPELAASLEFILGRTITSSLEQSRQHYEKSLTLWEDRSDLERQGCVYFSLGVWWRTYAAQHRYEYDQACEQAAHYFRQAIATFERANRSDLVAKFINPLGEVLQRLQQWEELETVARKSLDLNQTHANLYRQAHAHGFLASVALSKSKWSQAKQDAETALQLLETAIQAEVEPLSAEQQVYLNWEKAFNQGWYLFSLGTSQWHLGQHESAIQALKAAQAKTNPDFDPYLYIQILRELRSFHFEQKDYLEAFETRMLYRSIEQQYGFRAFVGAGRLQPHRAVINPALVGVDEQNTISQEISASGRQQDVNRLIERISRSDQRLTVLHGQSGVGKSSILQAGLLPALSPVTFDTREVVTILQQVYTNWTECLGQELLNALQSFQRLRLPENLNSTSRILEQLRHSVSQNLMVVLIFDQFEEFFFVYKDPVERKKFYDFLKNCLNIPYIKVILSLREDYLHYLLECNDRLVNLDVINNNILDKNILFYLGNFTCQDAKSVVRALTQNTPFPLEQELVEELVNDLAGELGEVRPIELQITGAQLQSEEITTLQQYRERGPKDALVERFLEEVTKDCGAENEQFAKLVLYLLTDENNTRPLKTRDDLAMELGIAEKLDLILTILVRSGLVFKIPASPADRYQLVHDYLVLFVRQRQSAQLIGELEKEREERKLTEAKLNQALRKQLKTSRRATYSFAAFAMAIAGFAVVATLAVVNTYLSSQSLAASKKNGLDSLVANLKTAKLQKALSVATIPEFRLMTMLGLSEATGGIREINRLEGHTGSVSYVEFSADGKSIATASEDKTAKVWSQNGALLATLSGHADEVTYVSFSSDGKLLVTASKDKTAKVWRSDGSLLTTLKGHTNTVNQARFSPDGTLVATAGEDRSVRVWKIDGTLLRKIPFAAVVTTLRFSPDGKTLATASKDDIVRLLKLDGQESKLLNNYGALDIRFTPDSRFVTLINKDRTVRLWTIDGQLQRSLRYCCGYSTKPGLSPDNKLIASVISHSPSLIELYSFDYLSDINFFYNEEYLGQILGHNDAITYLAFNSDGKLLASASKDKTVRIWNLNYLPSNVFDDSKTKINNIQFNSRGDVIAVGYPDKVELRNKENALQNTLQANGSILELSPDSSALLTSSKRDEIRLWKSNGNGAVLKGHNGFINSIFFSPNGQLIASASDDNTIKLWSQAGRLIKTLTGHKKPIDDVVWSSDGEVLASRGQDNTVILWRKDGSLIKRLKGHLNQVTDVQFSDDGRFVASIGDDNLLKLWRSDGTPIKTLFGHADVVKSIQFSPNSQMLASVSGSGVDSTIKLWRIDGSLLETIRGYNVHEVIFSPDGRIIAAGESRSSISSRQNKTVQLWDLNGNLIATLEGHGDAITGVEFTPDGKVLATASVDSTVKLWKPDGTPITTLRGHNVKVTEIAFSFDGKMLVSVSTDNKVKLWRSNGEDLKTLQEPEKDFDESGSYQDNFVEFSSDNEKLLFIGKGKDSKIKLWNRKGSEIFNQQGSKAVDEFAPTYYKTHFSENMKSIAIATQENALKLWGIDGNLRATLDGHTDTINDAKFSVDGSLIASASDDKTVRLWQRNGKLLKTLNHQDKVNSISFSSTKLIASASDDKTVKLWHHDGKLFKTLNHDDKVNSVSFNPSGDLLASASDDKTIKLWRSDGTLIKPLPHDDKVKTVTFSPDGKFLASVSQDGIVKIWNSSDGRELTVHKGTSDSEPILSFSPDSKMLAIRDNEYSNELTIYVTDGVWFKETSISLKTGLADVRFNPDGKTIAFATGSEVQFLDLTLDKLLERGCNWARNYLVNNPNVEEGDRTLCDDIGSEK